MNMPFFSIIIPIYNGMQSGFPKCLKSIWSQGLEELLFEVICIDDCSTDNTLVYLKEQSAAHSNIRIVHNFTNLKQGASRNIGIRLAKGEYLLFLDSDDYYHPGSLRFVYNHLKNLPLDVLVNDSTYQFGNKEHNRLQLNFKCNSVLSGEDFILKNGYVCSPWRLTIKRNLLIDNNLFFVENNSVEDIDWSIALLFYSKKVQYLSHILVHYVKGNTGITDNMYRDIHTISDNIEAGNRTYYLSMSIYKNSKAREIIVNIACSYYFTSTKFLLCIWDDISNKKLIIAKIPKIVGNRKLVKVAQQNPTIFSILSNFLSPLFRFIRFIQRCRIEKMYANL